MIIGVDNSFLVPVEVIEHPNHAACRRWLGQALRRGDHFALAPQVLAEFIHVVTDQNRFENPLTVEQATHRSESWWNASEVTQVYPNQISTATFHDWLRQHRLGRKRLLDTMLASTYYGNSVTNIVSADVGDFAVFGLFQVHNPAGGPVQPY